MKVVIALVLLEAVAMAGPLVTAPSGWKGGANAELVQSTGAIPHFGGVHGIIEGERYDAPKPGIVLYAARIAATTNTPAIAAQAELANVEPSNVKDAKVAMASQDNAIVASLDWKDASAGIQGSTRMVIAATKDKVVAVKGECIAAADADAALVAACKQALASLDTGIAASERQDLTSTSTSISTSTSTIPPELKLPDEPLHAKAPPMVVPDTASPRTDARPIVVGASLIALAAVFYWNRKRRERIEKEQGHE